MTINITGGGRELLTAARTYYVRTDGSDSNSGLVDSAGGAFLTIQKAINTAASLDSSIYDVTIQLATGTYSTSVGNVCKNMVGAGSVIILGDETTPSNVVIDTGAAGLSLFDSTALSTVYKLKGMQLKSTGGGTCFGVLASVYSYVEIQALDFNTGWTQQMRVADGGSIKVTGNYTISGGASTHITSVQGVFRCQSKTVTITGTPAFSTAFLDVSKLGFAIVTGNTFSGSATGIRYKTAENSVISSSAATLPGDTAGTATLGGIYS